jgi:hypothetical protein
MKARERNLRLRGHQYHAIDRCALSFLHFYDNHSADSKGLDAVVLSLHRELRLRRRMQRIERLFSALRLTKESRQDRQN